REVLPRAIRRYREDPWRRSRAHARAPCRGGTRWPAPGFERAWAGQHLQHAHPVCSGRGCGVTTVLVIEDDPAILRGLADNLSFEGYQVLQAHDAETGRQLHSTGKPDLIVLDLMLPRMSGIEFCRRLRASADHTPILMVTARSEEADRVLGLDVGADDY